MEFIQLVGLMGQAPDEPQLRQHLVDAGITRQPRPPEGEDSAYVQFAEQGYEMRFDVEADDNTRMLLRAITAFPKGGGAYKQFAGKLPLDIAPGESRDQLLARLGSPAIRNAHNFLGVRRRWFEYTPPPTWCSRPRGFRTEWTPLAFPRERAMLVVWPALPRDAVGDGDVALGAVIGTHPSAAVIDHAPIGVTGSASGLRGKACHVVRKTADGPAIHTHGVVLVDERYVYPLRLELSDGAQREHAHILDEVVRTVVPVPRPQVVATDVPAGIWNE